MALLEVNDLSIEFRLDGRWYPVVSNVSFAVERGEVVAVVGESGCGKSVTCLALARLLPMPPARYASGQVRFTADAETLDVLALPKNQLRRVRGGGIAYIFQEPTASLNPVFRVGDQIAEAIELHRPEITDREAEVIRLLQQVGIADPQRRIRCYPHELSGGMQQRIMIAMALASHPHLLVADEPTTALDVTIQAQILDLLRRLGSEREMGILLVTHNLGIVAEMADRVIVMYAGHTVEAAPVKKLLASPLHPYTAALLAAVPRLNGRERKLTTIPGTVPPPTEFPAGCRFYGRCQACTAAVEERCRTAVPPWRETIPGHYCRCWLTQPGGRA